MIRERPKCEYRHRQQQNIPGVRFGRRFGSQDGLVTLLHGVLQLDDVLVTGPQVMLDDLLGRAKSLETDTSCLEESA